ncbi:hypothetical protein [uncultured Fibrobacter sp.]|uniref:hypothetical protein n=1 Tax=uncultured Fibrobacter sp. TaxID=261512 RepID=UPI0025E41595|nr:hypothetical protein [uncultured Fibrobacter sp.]
MGLLERQIALDYIYPKSGAPQGHLFLIFWGCKKLELLQIKINYEFMKKAYEIGMAEKRAREAANGGVDPCFRKV